jgi:hypothetical protein
MDRDTRRPPPRSLALDHRIDGDVADPDLLHRFGSAAICCSSVISAPGAVRQMARGPARYAEPLILSKTRFLRKRFR